MVSRLRAIGLFIAVAIPALAVAQSGHFIDSGNKAPTCGDIGTQLRCEGKVAGLGGETFELVVTAPGTAITQCRNHGGNVAPGQNSVVQVSGTSGVLETPRNGHYGFSVSTNPPMIDSSVCPNDLWEAEVVDVIFGSATISLFEDGTLVDEVIISVE